MDSIVEEFGPIPTEDSTSQSKGKDEDETDPNKGKDGEEKKTQPGPVKKRKNSGGGGGSGKKLKVDGSKIKTIESVGTAGAILDVPLVNGQPGSQLEGWPHLVRLWPRQMAPANWH